MRLHTLSSLTLSFPYATLASNMPSHTALPYIILPPHVTLASNASSHTALPYIILPIRHYRQQYVFTHCPALHYPFPTRHSRQQYVFTHCPALHYPSPIRHSRQQYALTHCPALHYYWCPVKLFRGALPIANRLNYCELQTYFIINTPVYTNTAGAAQNKHKLILRRDTAGHTVIAYRHKKASHPKVRGV